MADLLTAYKSPVRLVLHAAEEADPFQPTALSRARKKLAAEMALAGGELVLDGIAYSRQEAATLLDTPTEADWRVHLTLWSKPGLLAFLEKQEFDLTALQGADNWRYQPGLVDAVSPYFAYSFQTVSGRLLREEDWTGLRDLLDFESWITPDDHHPAFEKIRRYFDDLSYTLRNLSWEKFAADESVLHFLFDDDWQRFVNHLPPSLNSHRDAVVEQVTNLVLGFQNKATWYYLHRVLVQLKEIETNDYNRSEVERIDAIIGQNSRIEGKRGQHTNRRPDGWQAGWWTLWVVLFFVRVVTCNNNRTEYRYDSPPPPGMALVETSENLAEHTVEKRNEPVLLSFLDTLSRQVRLPASARSLSTGGQPFSSFADNFSNDGPHTVRLVNQSGHDCAVLRFDGPSHSGAVYAGALPHVSAVYIRNGDEKTVKVQAGSGAFHFVVGDGWAQLATGHERTLVGPRNSLYPEGRRHTVFLYEYFHNQKPLPQPYLRKGVYLLNSGGKRSGAVLNKPQASATETVLTLVDQNGSVAVKASGQLAVVEDVVDR